MIILFYLLLLPVCSAVMGLLGFWIGRCARRLPFIDNNLPWTLSRNQVPAVDANTAERRSVHIGGDKSIPPALVLPNGSHEAVRQLVRDSLTDGVTSRQRKLADGPPDAKLQRGRRPSSLGPGKVYIESVAQGSNPQEAPCDSRCLAVSIRHCTIYGQQVI